MRPARQRAWRSLYTTFVAAALTCEVVRPTLAQQRVKENDQMGLAARGAVLFGTTFTPAQGLGPLFNNTSCRGCHGVPTVGGMGPEGLGTVTRVGRLTPTGFDPLIGRGGPIARSRSVAEQELS